MANMTESLRQSDCFMLSMCHAHMHGQGINFLKDVKKRKTVKKKNVKKLVIDVRSNAAVRASP